MTDLARGVANGSHTLRLPTALALFVGTALVAGIGVQIFDEVGERVTPVVAAPGQEGKAYDRLSFVDEDVPTRTVRIHDTLAMFALPQADARTWAEQPAPAAQVPEKLRARTAAASVPRMVSAESDGGRKTVELPPARPLALKVPPAAAAAPAPTTVAAVQTRDAVAAEAERTPVEVLGVTLPGTEYLPTRKDARETVAAVGDKAAALGGRTVTAVSDTASAVGDTLSSFGKATAETLGFR